MFNYGERFNDCIVIVTIVVILMHKRIDSSPPSCNVISTSAYSLCIYSLFPDKKGRPIKNEMCTLPAFVSSTSWFVRRAFTVLCANLLTVNHRPPLPLPWDGGDWWEIETIHIYFISIPDIRFKSVERFIYPESLHTQRWFAAIHSAPTGHEYLTSACVVFGFGFGEPSP